MDRFRLSIPGLGRLSIFFPILSQRPTVISQFKYQFVYFYFLFPGFGKYTADSRFIEDGSKIHEIYGSLFDDPQV